MIETAKRLGVQSELPAVPSLALGSAEVTLMEMTRAYAAVATGNLALEPYTVRAIQGTTQQALFTRPAPRPRTEGLRREPCRDARPAASGGARGNGQGGASPERAGRRQDGHHAGVPRRLVHRLHAGSRRRRLGRQRRQRADEQGRRRRPAGGDLARLPEPGRSAARQGQAPGSGRQGGQHRSRILRRSPPQGPTSCAGCRR